MAGAHQRINNYITVTKLTVTRERIHTRALGAPWGGSNQRGEKKKKIPPRRKGRSAESGGRSTSNLSTNDSSLRGSSLFEEENPNAFLPSLRVDRKHFVERKLGPIRRREEEGALLSKGSKV